MKIDRRSFLSLGIGAAVGINLSPLPWKLTDDLSIWTQNWPWTPVPEDGEASYADSVCGLCPGGCGITVRKIDDRAIKIEGMKGYPVNDGGICMLGLSGLQLLYGHTRVKSPMKRVGKRGDGNWEAISWNEAIELAFKKLGELRSGGQSDAVGCVTGFNRGTTSKILDRFLMAYGSPNFFRMPSMRETYELALKTMHGVQADAGFDLENAGYVLSFGCGILDGWGSPVRSFAANASWKNNKVKVVQIEPRLSNTATKADKWVAIIPGTETALALGMANVIINEGLYDKAFVEGKCKGFDKLKALVGKTYTPEAVEKLTGVDKATISELAKEFAKASKPLAVCGKGRGETAGSLTEFMAVHTLNILAGNIGKKGGVFAVAEADITGWPAVIMDAVTEKGIKKSRVDGAGSDKYPNTKSMMNRFPEFAGSLDALLVSGANPCYSLSNAQSVKNAIRDDLYVISFSSYMDETTQLADLVLPNHTYLERFEDISTPAGYNKSLTALAKPVIEPLFDTKHTADAIIELAKKFGGTIAESFPWDNYEACLKGAYGDKWDTLETDGLIAGENATGEKVEKVDFSALAKAAKNGIVGAEGDGGLTLIPCDSIRLASGHIGDPPFMMKTVSDRVLVKDDIFVEVNPQTARSAGFDDGDYAILSTSKGKAKVRVRYFEGIRPGVVAMPRGLGHTGNDKYLSGKGVNFNDLIGPVEDPVSGLDAAWGIRANLAKA